MNQERVYYEVKVYLDYLGDYYIKKVPPKLYDYIISMAEEYQKSDNFEMINSGAIEENGRNILSKEARIILFNLDYSFFTKSEEEKRKLHDFIKQNETLQREEQENSIFGDRSITDVEKQDNETLDAMYERIKLIEKYLDDLT